MHKASIARTALLMALACPGATALADPERAAPPNFLVILVDDLGYGDLGCYGGVDIPTPRIDDLARQGVRFTSAYVTAPVCGPSRQGLLTGRYQQRWGTHTNEQDEPGPPVDERFLPGCLRDGGYATGMFGKWHVGAAEGRRPLDRGFDRFYGFLGGSLQYLPESRKPGRIMRDREAGDESEHLTDAITRETIRFVDATGERPWFAMVAYNAVHLPLEDPPEYASAFDEIADPRRRTLARMLAHLDANVGALVDHLNDAGQLDRTVVIFLSDNGGLAKNATTNGPLSGEKKSLAEGGIRVPMFVHAPARFEARVCDEPVSSLDLLPTVLDLAGAPPKPDADGASLRPLLEGGVDRLPARSLYWFAHEQRAIRRGPMKYVVTYEQPSGGLYDLSVDPGERHNLLDQRPDIASSLRAELDAWCGGMPAPRRAPR